MLDREKIKAGLISCTSVEQWKACPVCPYKPLGNLCNIALMRDALAAIREQDPRIIDIAEIHGGMTVWLEDDDIMLAIGGSSVSGSKCFITEQDRSIAVFDDEYNIRWRAWTAKPTDEQRKAVPWNER